MLRRRGAVLIGVGRFVPGGHAATTFAAGTLEMPYRQFVVADAFKDSLWLPLATSFAAAMAVGAGFEGWRRLQSRRGKDILGDELPEEASALEQEKFPQSTQTPPAFRALIALPP